MELAPLIRPISALLTVFALGCSAPDPSIVAEGSGWSLTVEDLVRDYTRAYPEAAPFADLPSGEQAAFLETSVNAKVLVKHARESVSELDWPMQRRVWAEEEQWLVDRAVTEASDGVEISSGDFARMRTLLDREVHIQRIVAEDRETAEACFAEIVAGGLAF
ncbi:MAG: hypothetical protein ACYTFT_17375, partial [Planctomycetota bacterium]